jgi:hypothetical protein
VVVEVNDHVFFGTLNDAAEAELAVFYLGALRKGGFGHKKGNLLHEW